MSKRCMRIEEVENGYNISITIPPQNPDSSAIMYPEPMEFVAKSKDEVVEFLASFLDHTALKQVSEKRDIFLKPQKPGTLISA